MQGSFTMRLLSIYTISANTYFFYLFLKFGLQFLLGEKNKAIMLLA